MKLSQAIAAFANDTVDGWDQVNGHWILNIAKGSILTFDRFITERSFGQKKRIFQMPGKTGLPENIEAIRDHEGNTYLVSYYNIDADFGERYNTVYLIQRADHTAELIRYNTVTAASGAAAGKSEVVVATFPVDFEKISTSNSREYGGVHFSGYIANCPASVDIGTDNELLIDGTYYNIEEVYETIGLKGLKLAKRSGRA